MIFDASLINLVLYCMQQLGIALGLGSQTILLVAYVIAMRDGIVDDKEELFLRATRATLWVALSLIVISGAAITLITVMAGQLPTVLSSAYLFKILLIAVVALLTALIKTFPETIAEGLLGGTWYALFVVHILRPDASWVNLFTLLGIWMVGFNLLWYAVVYSSRNKASGEMAPAKITKTPEAAPIERTAPRPAPIPAPVSTPTPAPIPPPAQFKPIAIDPVPSRPPVAPAPGFTPPTITQIPAIKTQAPPPNIPPQPVEKMPAGIATDTPFLPQVPPLQPIPVIVPTAPQPAATVPPVATIPTNIPSTTQPPILQKPEGLPATPAPEMSPEIKMGLNVMPKAPGQIKT